MLYSLGRTTSAGPAKYASLADRKLGLAGPMATTFEGVCHVQVSRYLWMMVGEDLVTLRGVLGENRSVYGYYIWIFQSGAEHPSDLVEVEVKLKVPEGADFSLYEADKFFTEPLPAEDRRAENQEETLVFDNGLEGLLIFVQRASGEGEYVLTVRAYVAYWKTYWHLPAMIVVSRMIASFCKRRACLYVGSH